MAYRRLTHADKELALRSGGAVIAFVGSEATGKTTLLKQMQDWLGEHFAVDQIHAGKPRSTALTFLPNLFLPMLRSLMPGACSTKLEAEHAQAGTDAPRSSWPFIFVLARRAAGLRPPLPAAARLQTVRQRRAGAVRPLSLRAARRSRQPAVDPADGGGGGDEAQAGADGIPLLPRDPPPDLVIYLIAPLEITLVRNASRGKVEPEDYVRQRHARASNLQFERTRVVAINTDQPFEQTALEVKKAIWSLLKGSRGGSSADNIL